MDILLLTLTDDPFDPPGAGRFGGSHAFFFDLSRQFVRRGHDLTIVTRLNSSCKPRIQELGPLCRLYRLEVGSPTEMDHHSMGSLRDELADALAGLLSGKTFDIVQTSNWLSGAVGIGLVPVIARRHVHHLLSLGRTRIELGEEASCFDGVRDVWERRVFNEADTLICVSRNEKDALERLYPDVRPQSVSIIPYGIDSQIFSRRPESADDFIRRTTGRFP
ncbi:MAG: glycosyltransferase [Magnetospirillum sp. WYHS-4]